MRNRLQQAQNGFNLDTESLMECYHAVLQLEHDEWSMYQCYRMLYMKVVKAGSLHRVARDAGRDVTYRFGGKTPDSEAIYT
jgi:hypothetical protein